MEGRKTGRQGGGKAGRQEGRKEPIRHICASTVIQECHLRAYAAGTCGTGHQDDVCVLHGGRGAVGLANKQVHSDIFDELAGRYMMCVCAYMCTCMCTCICACTCVRLRRREEVGRKEAVMEGRKEGRKEGSSDGRKKNHRSRIAHRRNKGRTPHRPMQRRYTRIAARKAPRRKE